MNNGLLRSLQLLLVMVSAVGSVAHAALNGTATSPILKAAGQWSYTGSMTTARMDHTATLLPNGKVLVAGGHSGNGAEIYDPSTGSWSSTGSTTTWRSNHTATLLSSGKVLVTGGGGPDCVVSSAEIYDPATGTWTATAPMQQVRVYHTATLLPNGKVLITGGGYVAGDCHNGGWTTIASAEIYDPDTGVWTPTGSLHYGSWGHTTTLLPNGKVLVAGGYFNWNRAELYDPATGVWTVINSMGTGRAGHTATLLPNGTVLVVGGYIYDGSHGWASSEIYDPTTGNWTVTGSMSTIRLGRSATLLSNGKVLVTGGYAGDYGVTLSSAELYDPATTTWTTTNSINTARSFYTATLLPSGQVLIAGGVDGSNTVLTSAELYTQGTEIFSETFSTTISAPNDWDFHNAYPFGFNALVEDASGRLHFGYTNDKAVKYAYLDSGSTTWNVVTLANVAKSGRTTSLAVVDSNTLYLLAGSRDRISTYTGRQDAKVYKVVNGVKTNEVTWLADVNDEASGPQNTSTGAVAMLLNANGNLNLFGQETGWYGYGHQLYGRTLDSTTFTLSSEFPVSNLQGSLDGSRNMFGGAFLKANGDLQVGIGDGDNAAVRSTIAPQTNYTSWTDMGVYAALSNLWNPSSTLDASGNVHSVLVGPWPTGAFNTIYYSLNHGTPETVFALGANQDFNCVGSLDIFVSTNGDAYIAYYYRAAVSSGNCSSFSSLYVVKKSSGGSWGSPIKLTEETDSLTVGNPHFVRSNSVARVPSAPYLAYVQYSGSQRSGNVWQGKQIKILKLSSASDGKTSQTIGAITFNPTTVTVGGTTTASATATSGLPVTFTSQTTSVCSTNGSIVTGVAAGACTIAANQAGNASYNAATQVTQNLTVTAPAGSPIVTTNAASSVTATAATLNGQVNSNGATATITFEFGSTIAYGETVVAIPTSLYGSSVVTGDKTGLTCGTPYHFRVKAINSSGTSYGDDVSFTTSDCPTYTVTPSAGAESLQQWGSINPNTPQTVAQGATTTFTITPFAGYIANVGGTCGGYYPIGPNGGTYTTNAITADCTVEVTWTLIYNTVTPTAGTGGSISPNTPQSTPFMGRQNFTLTPDTGYSLANVGGTCGGTLAGTTYTTNYVTASCTVIATFSLNTYTVTPNAGSGGSISPNSAQTVTHGATQTFTITPNTSYNIANVTGCNGSLIGNTYTTGPMTEHCTVNATFGTNSTGFCGTDWQWANPLPQGNTLKTVIYGNNKFVAAGANGTILNSSDGTNWTAVRTATESITSIIWNGNQFLAVAYGGNILTSTNGITWTKQTTYAIDQIEDVTWNGQTFVTLGVGIATSPDGITWSTRTPNTTNRLYDVIWSGTQFVAVGAAGSIITSPDGTNWTLRTSGTTKDLYAITWGGNQFVTAGASGIILTSTDGNNWTNQTINSGITNPLYSATYNGTQFVVAGSGFLRSSVDGTNWITRFSESTKYFHDVTWGNNQFIAVGEGGLIFTSPNGNTWTINSSDVATNKQLSAIVWANNKFVIVGNNIVLTSPNGVNWTVTASGTTGDLRDIAWNGNQFVAGGTSMYSSPDAVNWTQRTTTPGTVANIIWTGSQFVTVTPSQILTSPNGITWTAPTTNIGTYVTDYTKWLKGVSWNGNKLVAVGGSGTILTSSDAVTWTVQNSNTTKNLNGIAWNGTKFVVAVSTGYYYEANFVLTSSDGITWTSQSTGVTNGYGNNNVVWDGTQFIAVGTQAPIITSTDGLTWLTHTITSLALNDVAWNGTQRIAVGFSGVSNSHSSSLILTNCYQTITPSAGIGGNINPNTPQKIATGATKVFAITPNVGYNIDSVGGCSGNLVGNTYTTGAITENCTVNAAFIVTHTVTPTTETGGNINPNTVQTLNHGAAMSFTVTPNTGYNIANVNGCGGSLVGNTYTTGSVNADCIVNVYFGLNGSCGTSNGANLLTAPTTGLCGTGTASVLTGTGPWNWSCAGSNGGTAASCSALLKVNGSCGTSNGANLLTAPTTGLCGTGTASALTGTGPWNWSCAGSNGGTAASCSALLQVNGSCGTSNGANFLTAPTTGLCGTGTASALTGTGPWNWSCAGTNGGTAASCSALLQVNGSCGTSNGANFLTAPTANLCGTGTASVLTGTGPWNWSCAGSNGGTAASCSALLQVNGSCGTSNGANLLTAPTTGLCGTGTASALTGTGPWNWSCAGSNGGTAASCSALLQVNGSCGTSNGANFLTAPTANLCSAGTASALTGTGPWNWSCAGSNGGTAASCSALLQVNGSCGTSNGANLLTAPTTGLCGTGTASALTGTGPWNWSCVGTNGGTAASCSALLQVNGSCGTSNGANLLTAPTANLCGAGTASVLTGTGPWNWSCTGSNGGTAASCSALLQVNGSCGTSNGTNVLTAPTTGLCGTGTASALTGTGPWNWSCAGSNGGTAASCSALLQVNGSCGTSNGANFLTAPTANLCGTGTASALTGTGPWNWSCAGSNGGTAASCAAQLQINGSCGTSNGANFLTAPTANLCGTGTASALTGTGPWNWSCAGSNGGTAASCSALLKVNGSCGTSNGANFLTAPTANLCGTGTASVLTGTGPWNWSCTGTNGGTAASCSALLKVNGSCGTSNGANLLTAPTTGLCGTGTASALTGTGPWNWSCAGSNGGTAASCAAQLQINGSCGTSNGANLLTAPTTGLCGTGTASVLTGTGPWNWSCAGSNGGTAASCSALLQVNGSCGTSNGANLLTAPTTGLCGTGTASALTGTGPWNWSCAGSNGGTAASCSALLQVNGACGTSNGANLLTAPTTGLCGTGTASALTGTGPWNWSCAGSNGGTAASCSALLQVNGACGTSNGANLLTAPTTGLCGTGTASALTGTGPWNWSCAGSNGGTAASCAAQLQINGSCGTSNGANLLTAPTTGLCGTGTASVLTGTGPWNWSCAGSNGGTAASCSALLKVNGSCGTSNGANLLTAPTTGLCGTGTASALTGTGPWNWSCAGSNGGTAASCSALLQVNGACGTSNGANLLTAPTTGLCGTGTASALTGTGPWNWSCAGSNGGTAASCSALLKVNGSCGTSNGANLLTAPTTGLCGTGTASALTGTGPWNWSCAGSNGGTAASCSALLQVNGACGTSNGANLLTAPTTGLCGTGTASALTGTGPWNWNCTGSNGGTAASCSALLQVNGACGTSNGANLLTAPTTGLCGTGTASALTGTGPWNWSCAGSNGGTAASCSALLQVNGACGTSNGANLLTAPTTGLCGTGTASVLTGTGPWNWSCTGTNGGTAASCAAQLQINGSCGTSNGANLLTAPTTGLCGTGTASALTGTGPWNWSCAGSNGGTAASCSALLQVNGSCGTSNGANLLTAPTTGLCGTGTASVLTGTGPWNWSCAGSNGGTAASCSALLQVNGACGTSNGANLLTAPTTGLCGTGTASALTGTGPWNWSCAGSNGGTAASCSALLQVNGSCGTSNGANFLTAPTANLCGTGTASVLTGTGPWNWSCTGSNGGTAASCSALLKVNGSCGTSNGANFLTAPTANLCGTGTASVLTGTGPWNWSCAGSNGGTAASCAAQLQINGSCGTSNGANLLTAPTTGLCGTGTASVLTGTGPWNWSCAGSNGGTAASCSALLQVNGSCGTSNGANLLTAPTTGLCGTGTASALTGTGPWNWSCAGSNGGTAASCSALLQVNGACGTSNGANLLTAPTTGLCGTGTASALTGTGPWNWSCAGSNGGTAASCSALLQVNGACGTSNGANLLTAPTTGLCGTGTASALTGTGPWNWSCAGSNGGTAASCAAQLQINGSCGTSNGANLLTAPTTGLCGTGTASVLTGTGPWNWSCAGSNGGTAASCSALLKVNGSCGTSNGANLLTAPTTGLCGTGTASALTGTGPWNWSCAGSNGGTAASCSALLQVNGACGTSNGANLLTAPTTGLCGTGTASALTGTGPWNWSCAGSNGGTAASCSALLKVNGSCGTSNGANLLTAPTTGLCGTGTASALTGTGPWNWSCAGSNGGTAASCSALLQVNGACGTSNGANLLTAPTTGLCGTGTASALTGTGPWNWNCTGSNGGTAASCSALLQVNGACGTSNGANLLTAPTTGLCGTGTASALTGTGPWNWSCAGSNGGTAASCSALLQVNGACGTSNGANLLTAPTTGLCGTGTASVLTGTGPWNWSCTGTNGGTAASCAAQLQINGSCGTSNGANLLTAPTTGLCGTGTASALTGTGPWNWSCAGSNGGTAASCSALLQVNGSCGTSNGANLLTAPTTGLCGTGTASVLTGTGPWNWSCAGSNGGTAASCSALLQVNGACGTSNGANLLTAPTTGLCGTGTASALTGTGPWNWSCAGSNGGTAASCSALLQVNGSCGTSNGANFLTAPTANLCGTGTASVLTGTGPWNWSCTGSNGGTAASCSALLKVNGSCGTSNGANFLTAPTANLCGTGTASVLTGTGPWNWSCTGSNGGTAASCSALLKVNGSCGTSNGANFLTAPTANLCGTGTASVLTGTGPWNWSCAGSNGGTAASCSALLQVNGSCGTSNGANLLTAPTTGLCGTGTASALTGTGPWNWSCAGSNGGTAASCSALLQVNGACGTSNGANLLTAPTTGLCGTGTASALTGTGPWNWNCTGSNGGTAASCSALLQVNGACGTSNGANLLTAPTANLCGAGTASVLTGTGPWNWSCAGSNGGTAASCSALLKVNGSCGTSNGTNVLTAPTANLCGTGTASVLTGTGPWNWSCAGSNGGTAASCAAQLQINGSCGTSNGANLLTAPTTGLCGTGTASVLTGTGPWNWSCAGSNGGTAASCSALLKVNGSCGTSNGANLLTAPTTGLCGTGTASALTGTGPWNWSCAGSNGGTAASCSALLQVNGACGTSNGANLLTAPTTGLCGTGTASALTGTGPWNWNCTGSNGGTAASCSALLQVNGACGTSNGANLLTAPTTGLCGTGTASALTGTGPWNWSCAGSNGGTAASCSALLQVNGACGTSNGANLLTAPTTGLCGTGTASVLTGTGPWNWSCTGTNGGTAASCAAQLQINGSCGTSNGANLLTAPTTGLCGTGTASALTGTGPWNWSCAGSNGGTAASCSALLQVNGSCGTSNGANLLTAPTTGLCGTGTASVLTGTGPWNWSCAGSNGGTAASCSALLKVNGSCGTSNGANFLTAPTANLCGTGTASVLTGTGPWNWSCTGTNGGTAASCSALLKVNGSCGTSNGANLLTAPTTGLCGTGTASALTGTGPWNWSCAGSNGGTAASCAAQLQINGSCGTSNGANLLTAPTTGLCGTGTASVLTGTGPWNWSCAGSNGGTAASCSALLQVNGSCGTSNGANLLTAPTTGLCGTGTASALTGTGPWNWSCAGSNGGTAASCAANISRYVVTPSVGSGGTISPSGAQSVNYRTTKAFTVTPTAGYVKNTTVTGTCPQGSWSGNVWTTGPIVANCSVGFTFSIIKYTVTPNATAGGTVIPNTPQSVNYRTTKAFTVTPNAGYVKNTTVTGTCPQGSWNGNVWTTGVIVANCTVSFSFKLCGDANSNNNMNIVDALAVARYVVNLPPPPPINLVAADVDRNGQVTIADALLIAKRSINLAVTGTCWN